MNKPIKVLFDAGPLANGQKSGIGYYTYQLIEALSKNYPEQLQLVGHYFNFLGLKKPKLPHAPNINYRTSRVLPGKVLAILRRLGLQIPFEVLIKSRGDVALFPNYVTLPMLLPAKRIVVIHDLCFEDFPRYLQEVNRNFLKRFVPRSAKTASAVITISQSTKSGILKHYKIVPDKILVTPIPPPPAIAKKIPAPGGMNLPKKFILFVGTLEPRKNYLALTEGYSLLPDELKQEYGLVLAGNYGWETHGPLSAIKLLQQAGEQIIITGYVSESTRAYLYQNASLLALPSHYEGFGMPILEAMSYGVPIAISDIPVFHEVAGPAAVYFDKDDPSDIARCLANILNNQAKREHLAKMSAKQLEQFDWDKVAASVMDKFKEVTGKR